MNSTEITRIYFLVILALVLKKMRLLSGNFADKHAANPTRMWQGTNSGFFHYAADGKRLNLKELAQ